MKPGSLILNSVLISSNPTLKELILILLRCYLDVWVLSKKGAVEFADGGGVSKLTVIHKIREVMNPGSTG